MAGSHRPRSDGFRGCADAKCETFFIGKEVTGGPRASIICIVLGALGMEGDQYFRIKGTPNYWETRR